MAVAGKCAPQVAPIPAPKTPTKPSPLGIYINDDMGYKVRLVGDKAPKGPYNDFRFGLKKGLVKFRDKFGSLAFDVGMWAHSPLNEFSKSKVRWWGGLNYINKDALNFFIAARVYAGFVPDGDSSMVAFAAATGIKPKLVGPLGLEVSAFGVFHEEYYNAPISNAKFYIGTVAPFVDLGNWEIRAIMQVWYIDTDMTDPTTHMQFGAGVTYKFKVD